jgi:rhodanese-related sulfurtransferase
MVAELTPHEVWEAVQRGDLRILDLRTHAERRRYGWPPGAGKVSLLRHLAVPEGPEVAYLCQHANRSKLTGRSGAPEVAGGFAAWLDAGLPVEGRQG